MQTPQNKSTEQLHEDLAFMDRMRKQTQSDTRRAMYDFAIRQINDELERRQAAPVTPAPPPAPPPPIKHNTPPPPPPFVIQNQANQPPNPQSPIPNPQKQRVPPPIGGGAGGGVESRTIHAGHQHPVNSQAPLTATIEADHDADPYNPRIRITWADGYQFTGDETAIRGRLVTTLRDTCALRLVQKGRFESMWRWSSPWRAAGFLQAIIAIRYGDVPTLRDLDVKRPNDLTTTVFAYITEKALQTA